MPLGRAMRLLGTFALLAFAAVEPALAADLPVKAPRMAPAAVAPAFTWTGVYVGGSVGQTTLKASTNTGGLAGTLHYGCAACSLRGRVLGLDHERGQSEAVGEFLASDFIARQLRKGFFCAAVSSQSQLQYPEVKKSNIAQISVLQDAQMLGHDQIVEGLLVLAEFGLAESQHGVRGSVLLIKD